MGGHREPRDKDARRKSCGVRVPTHRFMSGVCVLKRSHGAATGLRVMQAKIEWKCRDGIFSTFSPLLAYTVSAVCSLHIQYDWKTTNAHDEQYANFTVSFHLRGRGRVHHVVFYAKMLLLPCIRIDACDNNMHYARFHQRYTVENVFGHHDD